MCEDPALNRGIVQACGARRRLAQAPRRGHVAGRRLRGHLRKAAADIIARLLQAFVRIGELACSKKAAA